MLHIIGIYILVINKVFLSKNIISGSITTAKKAIGVIDDSAFWFTDYIPDIIANFPILNIITHPILEGVKNIPLRSGVLLEFDTKNVKKNCLSDLVFYDSNGDSLEFKWADGFTDALNGVYDNGEEFSDNQMHFADIDHNGIVNVNDIVMVVQMILE